MSPSATRLLHDLAPRIDALADADRAATRNVESVLAWDAQTRRRITDRLGAPAGTLRTVQMLDWDDAPPPVAEAVGFWRSLPQRVDELMRGAWDGVDDLGDRSAARLWLLVRHCDRDNDLRREWLSQVDTSDGYGLALVTDRALAVAEGEQLYGTQVAWNLDGSPRFVFPVRDADRLDERRAAVGMRSFADDSRRRVSTLTIIRWLGERAGFAAASTGGPA